MKYTERVNVGVSKNGYQMYKLTVMTMTWWCSLGLEINMAITNNKMRMWD